MPGTRTITWNIGPVANASGTVHFTAVIVSPLNNGTIIYNTGTIDSNQTAPENTNTTQTTVTSAPDFNVDTYNYKAVNATTAKPGDTLSFTIYYKNTGNMDATGVVITDVVDANLTNVIPQDGGSYNAGTRTITWNIGPVAVKASGTVHFTAVIVSPLNNGTIIYNTGTIDSNQTAPENTNTTQTTVTSAPDFNVDTYNYKAVNATTAKPGDTLSFTIYYKNTGNMDATGVVITDVVDANLTNVIPQDGGSYNAGTCTIPWTSDL